MSRTEEISTGVKTAEAAAGEARHHAEETLEFARELIEFAYSHGWGGVAQSMTMVGELLEGICEQLATVETACETAHTTLDQIHDQMSLAEIVDHLATSVSELDVAHTTIEGTISLVDEAIQGAEQADHESLTAQLHNLRSEVEELFVRLTESRADADAERQEAENLGQQAEAPGSSGKHRRVVGAPTHHPARRAAQICGAPPMRWRGSLRGHRTCRNAFRELRVVVSPWQPAWVSTRAALHAEWSQPASRTDTSAQASYWNPGKNSLVVTGTPK